ncbi:MAG TPA: hypothetical protein PKH77_18945 [Anaerolineae bacterium]|nr:hypothetical protein [Anaerolineae bacterium]
MTSVTKHRIWLIAIVTLTMICFAVVCVGIMLLRLNPDIQYIQRTTGILLPMGFSQVDTFDNTEFYVVAHVRLRADSVADFLYDYGFDDPEFFMPWLDVLKPENRTLPADAKLYYLEGRSATNRWQFILDEKSGRLWMVVFYPDPGGTLP